MNISKRIIFLLPDWYVMICNTAIIDFIKTIPRFLYELFPNTKFPSDIFASSFIGLSTIFDSQFMFTNHKNINNDNVFDITIIISREVKLLRCSLPISVLGIRNTNDFPL